MANDTMLEKRKTQSSDIIRQEDIDNKCNLAGSSLVASPSLICRAPIASGFKDGRKTRVASKEDQEFLKTITSDGKKTIKCGANCLTKLAAGIRKMIG